MKRSSTAITLVLLGSAALALTACDQQRNRTAGVDPAVPGVAGTSSASSRTAGQASGQTTGTRSRRGGFIPIVAPVGGSRSTRHSAPLMGSNSSAQSAPGSKVSGGTTRGGFGGSSRGYFGG